MDSILQFLDSSAEITVSYPMIAFSLIVAFGVGYIFRKLAYRRTYNKFHKTLETLQNKDEEELNQDEETYNQEEALAFEAGKIHTSRLILVKYKLPVTIKKNEDGTWDIQWDDLLNAVAALRFVKEKQIDFVGTCGYDREDLTMEERESLEDALNEYGCHPLFLRKVAREKMYNVFCKGILWPLFHYFSPVDSESYGIEYSSLWQAFNGVSMLFAKKASLVSCNEPRAVVWFDDYHLMLCPSFLRKQNPQAKIGVYLHTPFPSSEMFRVLPTRVELMRGLLCADCIGFHTYDYARHFLSSCKRVLDLDYRTEGGILSVEYCGRQCSVRIGHLGMDSERVADLSLEPTVGDLCSNLQKQYSGRKVILSVCGLGRGSVLKMQAIYEFLRSHPKWVQEVVFVEIINKFEESSEDNNREKRKDEYYAEVQRISETFGDDVIHTIKSCRTTMSYEEMIAYYKVADVALFVSFWDGFARTPFELTVVQEGKMKPAQLVLSEFMSCSRSLAGVIRVNPWNLNQVSEALHTALIMTPVERKVAHDRRYDYVMRYSFSKWALGFIADLERAAKKDENKRFLQIGWGSNRRMLFLPNNYMHIRTKEAEFLERFRKAKKRLLMFDYGGTLTESDDNTAVTGTFGSKSSSMDEIDDHSMPRAVRNAFNLLGKDENTFIGIISGQTKECLQSAFDDCPNVILSAEKGAFFKFPKTGWETSTDMTLDWKPVVLDLMREITDRTDGSWIDQKDSALVWHFENADPDYGNLQAYELERLIKRSLENQAIAIQRYDHSRIVEVLPKTLGKGAAAQRLFKHFVDHLGSIEEEDIWLFSCGNDRSDEEMFKIVQNLGNSWNPKSTFTCSVGMKTTTARYYLQDHSEVVGLLETLSQFSVKPKSHYQSDQKTTALHRLFAENRTKRSRQKAGMSKSSSWSFGLNNSQQQGLSSSFRQNKKF